MVRQAPLPRANISPRYGGSWRKISYFNELVKATLREAWPNLPILDAEHMMSMRADCRGDWLHFVDDNLKSPIFALAPLVQHLLEVTAYKGGRLSCTK